MPRNFMFTREEIVNAALDLTREQGLGAVTARAIGTKLGTSHRPVFSYFDSTLSALMQKSVAVRNLTFTDSRLSRP